MYLVFMALFSIVCIAVMPFFLLAQRKPSNRSLLLKMICASMFVLCGAFAIAHTGETAYGGFMMLGLVFSWFGDLFLHIFGKARRIVFPIGILSFLVAHVMYLFAYDTELRVLRPDAPILEAWELLPILAGMAVYLLIIIVLKTKLSVLMIPLSVYIFFLFLMCTRALTLASHIAGESLFAAILLGTGAVFFLLSDTSLGLLMFNKKCKASFPLKIFNIATYFIGQLMLAATILFIA